jgi:hypothetical protein
VYWAGINEPRPGGDGTLLGERVVLFRGGDSFEIFDQDGKTIGAAKSRGYRKRVGCQIDLRDAEVRAVVALATREWSWRGLVWKYVVCTPDGEEVAALTRPRGWRAAKQCTVARGTERIATLEKHSKPFDVWDRLLGPHPRWWLIDESGCHAARVTLVAKGEGDSAYVLEVESRVTGRLRIIALAACIVVDRGMASPPYSGPWGRVPADRV